MAPGAHLCSVAQFGDAIRAVNISQGLLEQVYNRLNRHNLHDYRTIFSTDATITVPL